MKKWIIPALALLIGAGAFAAQPAPQNRKCTATTVFTTDIVCHNCEKKIMNNIPTLGKGIEDVKVDLSKKEVTVVYDTSKNNDEQIVRGFAKLRVKAVPKPETTAEGTAAQARP